MRLHPPRLERSRTDATTAHPACRGPGGSRTPGAPPCRPLQGAALHRVARSPRIRPIDCDRAPGHCSSRSSADAFGCGLRRREGRRRLESVSGGVAVSIASEARAQSGQTGRVFSPPFLSRRTRVVRDTWQSESQICAAGGRGRIHQGGCARPSTPQATVVSAQSRGMRLVFEGVSHAACFGRTPAARRVNQQPKAASVSRAMPAWGEAALRLVCPGRGNSPPGQRDGEPHRAIDAAAGVGARDFGCDARTAGAAPSKF